MVRVSSPRSLPRSSATTSSSCARSRRIGGRGRPAPSSSLGRWTLPRKQLADAGKRRVDVGRHLLEVPAQVVQEVRERIGVEVLRAIRLVARLRPCFVERGLQLTDSPLTVCLRALVPPLEPLQASPQFTNNLAPRFCERERLLPGGGKVGSPAEVEIEEEAGQSREGRQCGDDGGYDGGHPAQPRASDW